MKKTSLLSSILFLVITFKTVNKYFIPMNEVEMGVIKQENEDRYYMDTNKSKYYDRINIGKWEDDIDKVNDQREYIINNIRYENEAQYLKALSKVLFIILVIFLYE